MPPGLRSRYFKEPIRTDADGRRYVDRREPADVRPRANDGSVVVLEGETLHHVAERALGDAQLFWIIADVNGIVDPTVALEPGRRLKVPARAEDFLP